MSDFETGAIADVIAEAQEAVQDVSPKKRERKPKLDAEGNPIVKAAKEPKAPKQYPVWNEDGTQAIGENGEPLFSTERTKKPKAPKQPRLDADGNPIVRRSNVFLDEQVIRRTEKAAEFKARPDSKRGQMFAAAEDGKTVGQFYAEMGGKAAAHTFLVWFVNAAEVLTIE